MRLLSQALTQFGGVVETKFEATGLLCKMNITLPENVTAGPDNGSAVPHAVGFGGDGSRKGGSNVALVASQNF